MPAALLPMNKLIQTFRVFV